MNDGSNPRNNSPISLEEALSVIRSGRFFSVHFIKRTNGELRRMNARVGVRKYLKGGGARYSFSENNLIPVYDLKKQSYRSIPIENIIRVNQRPVQNENPRNEE